MEPTQKPDPGASTTTESAPPPTTTAVAPVAPTPPVRDVVRGSRTPAQHSGALRRAIRREQVKKLLARSYTLREMATALNVSVRTIEVDVAAVRLSVAEEFARRTSIDVATEARIVAEELNRVAWALFHPKKVRDATGQETEVSQVDVDQKIKIMGQIWDRIDGLVKMMQRLGIVYRAAETHEVRHVIDEKLHSLTPDTLVAIGRATDDEEFERLLTLHLGPELAGQFVGEARESSARMLGDGAEDADLAEDDALDAQPPVVVVAAPATSVAA